jgi:hypothetical protein
MIKPACSVCLLLHLLQQNIKTCEQLMRNAKKKRAEEKKKIPLLSLSVQVCLSASRDTFFLSLTVFSDLTLQISNNCIRL